MNLYDNYFKMHFHPSSGKRKLYNVQNIHHEKLPV